MNPKLIKISLIIILGFFLIYPIHSQASWIIEQISTGNYPGGGVYNSIAVDPLGHPHISYMDSDPYVLSHAYWDGMRWKIEVVDNGDEGDVGWYNAIAIDSLGHIHISYNGTYGNTHTLKYAYFDGTKWTITPLVNEGRGCTSIAVDSNNYPHIRYINGSNELRYMKFNGSDWTAETVAQNAMFSPLGHSLALTSSGKAHIIYSDATYPYHLFWANNLSGTWEVEYLDDAFSSSLALDSLDNLHIVYIATFTGDIRYSRLIDSVWETQIIPDPTADAHELDIAIDSQNHPHICYESYSYDGTTEKYSISYTYFNGEEWLYSLIDSNNALNPSLALDEAGFPHVSYLKSIESGVYLKLYLNHAYIKGVAPPPPTNVQASDGTYLDKVEVIWEASATAMSYTVYRATSSSTYASKTNLGTTSDTFFNDTTAVPKTTYYYYVKASNYYGTSGYSAYNTGYRSDGSPPPPTNIQASDGTSPAWVRVSWTASPNATSYIVYRAMSTSSRATKAVIGTTSDTSYDDTTASVMVNHYYYVKASNTYGTSAYSAYDKGYRSDGRPPPPTNVQASEGTYMDKVQVTWTASPEATSYTVYRATSTSSRATKAVIGTTSDLSYNDTTASVMVNYYYYVKASNTYGTSAYSAYDKGYRSDGRPPPPTNVQASDGIYTDRVEVTWTVSPDADSYTVYRATSTSSWVTKTVLGTIPDTTFEDTTALAGKTYYYWVKASNSYGTSGFSAYDTGYR